MPRSVLQIGLRWSFANVLEMAVSEYSSRQPTSDTTGLDVLCGHIHNYCAKEWRGIHRSKISGSYSRVLSRLQNGPTKRSFYIFAQQELTAVKQFSAYLFFVAYLFCVDRAGFYFFPLRDLFGADCWAQSRVQTC